MERERALIDLGKALRDLGYEFVTVTPSTHARFNARGHGRASTLRDVFGWSGSFPRDALPASLFDLLAQAGCLVESGGLFRSAVRFSSLGGELFAHSAHPTCEVTAVFFGPDTYRFCAAIARARLRGKRVVDLGCGSGAGGIIAGRTAESVVLSDVNEEALAYSRVNAALAGLTSVEVVRSDLLAQVVGPVDLIVANPPFMRDEPHRVYRDGGGALGEGLSVRIVQEAAERLSPGGTLLLYTGAAIVDGRDGFREAATVLLREAAMTFEYEEVDPDVFGEELEKPGYAGVERIAAVVLIATRPG